MVGIERKVIKSEKQIAVSGVKSRPKTGATKTLTESIPQFDAA